MSNKKEDCKNLYIERDQEVEGLYKLYNCSFFASLVKLVARDDLSR